MRDSVATTALSDQDWDLLFRAALDGLRRCAVELPAATGSDGRLHSGGAVLRECLDALEQLRTAVTGTGFSSRSVGSSPPAAPTNGLER
jgi:hypothetical protein